MDSSPLDPSEIARLLDAREPQAAAEAAVEIAVGLFEADAAALWWRGDEGVRLVARAPTVARPTPMGDRTMPELLQLGDIGVATFLTRDEAPAGVAGWMDEHDLAAMSIMPMRLDDVGDWLFALSWQTAPDGLPPEESVARFADRVELILLRAMERKWREESALELADNVAQALVLGRTLFEMDDPEGGRQALDRALEHTQRIMSRLRHEDPHAQMVRMYPASLAADEEE